MIFQALFTAIWWLTLSEGERRRRAMVRAARNMALDLRALGFDAGDLLELSDDELVALMGRTHKAMAEVALQSAFSAQEAADAMMQLAHAGEDVEAES